MGKYITQAVAACVCRQNGFDCIRRFESAQHLSLGNVMFQFIDNFLGLRFHLNGTSFFITNRSGATLFAKFLMNLEMYSQSPRNERSWSGKLKSVDSGNAIEETRATYRAHWSRTSNMGVENLPDPRRRICRFAPLRTRLKYMCCHYLIIIMAGLAVV